MGSLCRSLKGKAARLPEQPLVTAMLFVVPVFGPVFGTLFRQTGGGLAKKKEHSQGRGGGVEAGDGCEAEAV